MNKIKIETLDLNIGEKLHIPDVISCFLESIAENNKIDVQDVMIWYDKRSGVLKVIQDRQPPIVLGYVEVNDL